MKRVSHRFFEASLNEAKIATLKTSTPAVKAIGPRNAAHSSHGDSSPAPPRLSLTR